MATFGTYRSGGRSPYTEEQRSVLSRSAQVIKARQDRADELEREKQRKTLRAERNKQLRDIAAQRQRTAMEQHGETSRTAMRQKGESQRQERGFEEAEEAATIAHGRGLETEGYKAEEERRGKYLEDRLKQDEEERKQTIKAVWNQSGGQDVYIHDRATGEMKVYRGEGYGESETVVPESANLSGVAERRAGAGGSADQMEGMTAERLQGMDNKSQIQWLEWAKENDPKAFIEVGRKLQSRMTREKSGAGWYEGD